MRVRILLICLVLYSISLKSQSIEFGESEKLPPTVNSTAEEIYPMISPDGQKLFFSRVFHDENVGGKYAGADIWISELSPDSVWQEAYNPGKPLNNKDHNYVIGFNLDGDKMYLVNTYKNTKKYNVASSVYFYNRWEVPEIEPISLPEHTGPVGMYMHPSEEILMVSMNAADSYGKEDIYVMLKDTAGTWSKPINLGNTINSSGYEISPFLDRKTTTLYFASEGHGGYGSADVFKSERRYGSWNVWGLVNNLGENVNGSDFDSYCFIDGQHNLYSKSNGQNRSDIYHAMIINKASEEDEALEKLLKEAKELLENP